MVEVVVGDLTVHFPFAPYAVQQSYMRAVVTALQTRQHALLESPTGTGKTLCLLCATLAWLLHERARTQPGTTAPAVTVTTATTTATACASSPDTAKSQPPLSYARRASTRPLHGVAGGGATATAATAVCRIVYCSRTHAQLTQVIRELKRSAYGAHVTMALLASREYMCVNSEVTKLPSLQAQQTACNALRADRACRYFRGLQAGNAVAQLDEAYLIHDMEDLVQQGRRCGFCPYYLERDAASDADVVFMPYNYVLDPLLRAQLPFELDGCVLIVDEAHNLPSVLSSAGCLNLQPLDLTNAIHDCARAMAAVRLGGGDNSNSNNSNNSNSMDAGEVAAVEQELASLKITLCRLEACIAAEAMTTSTTTRLPDADMTTTTSDAHDAARKRTRAVAADSHNNNNNNNNNNNSDNHSATRHAHAPLVTVAGELVRPGAYMRTFLAKALITRDVYTGGSNGMRGMSDAINKAVTLLSEAESPAGGLVRVQQFLDEVFADDTLDDDDDDDAASTRFVLQEQPSLPPPPSSLATRAAATSTPPRRVLGYWRLDNAPQLRALASRLRCMLLTSGTLSPLDHFAAELGVPFAVRLQGEHVVQPERVLSCVLCKAPAGERLNGSYALRSSIDYRIGLGMTLLNLARHTPGGTLVFFASYHAMHAAVDLWQSGVDNAAHASSSSSSSSLSSSSSSVRTVWGLLSELKPVFVEPANSADLATVVAAFQRTIDACPRRGAVLLAVCRGKVSEGVDFADHHGRCVLVAGIPYANHTELFVRLKRAYLGAVAPRRPRVHGRLFTGDDWYCNEAMRAVNQCVGRIIRHAHDYGAIVLADERFAARRSSLSAWVAQRTVVHGSFRDTHAAVARFFAQWSSSSAATSGGGDGDDKTSCRVANDDGDDTTMTAAAASASCVDVPASCAQARAYAAAQQQSASEAARRQQRERIAAALAQAPQRHNNHNNNSTSATAKASGGDDDDGTDTKPAAVWPCAPVQRMTRQTLASVAAADTTTATATATATTATTAAAARSSLPDDATSLQFSAYVKARLSAARYDDFRRVLKQLAACRAQLSSSSSSTDAVRGVLRGAFAQLRALLREADAHAEATLLKAFARHLPSEFRAYYTRYVESLRLDTATTTTQGG